MRQNASTQEHAIRPDKAVLSNFDGLSRLPAGFEIDAMCDELRSKSTDGGERSDPYSRGAINQMPAADPGMSFDDQLRMPVRLMGEMPARARGKTSNPIQLSDDCVCSEMEQMFLQRVKCPMREFSSMIKHRGNIQQKPMRLLG